MIIEITSEEWWKGGDAASMAVSAAIKNDFVGYLLKYYFVCTLQFKFVLSRLTAI